MQEDLFATVLYRVMEMAFITKLYQDTLDNNEGVWRAVSTLSEGVKRVGAGVLVLSDFNRQLNDSYIQSVRDITEVVNNHPTPKIIQSTNANLRRLVQEVHSGVYRSELAYEPLRAAELPSHK